MTEVTSLADFDALRSSWNALARRLAVPSPFHSWEWNRLWWNHFGNGRRLRILVIRDHQEVRGIAGFYERREGHHRLGVTVLEPIGWEDGGLQGLTEGLDLLFPEPDRAWLFSVLARWLEGIGWRAAWLPSLREGEALPAWIDRRVVRRSDPVVFHYRALPEGWTTLLAGLNKSMRDNVKYYPGLLRREGHPFSFEVAETPAEVAAALPSLFELHRLRAEAPFRVKHWNHFRRESRRAFIEEVAPALAMDGRLKIGLLHIGGQVVAAQMWLEEGPVVFMYYSGYLPAWSRYSVALVATIETLRHAMDRGLCQVEFLRGGGQLKERWDAASRMRWHALIARNPGLVKLALTVVQTRRRLAARLPSR